MSQFPQYKHFAVIGPTPESIASAATEHFKDKPHLSSQQRGYWGVNHQGIAGKGWQRCVEPTLDALSVSMYKNGARSFLVTGNRGAGLRLAKRMVDARGALNTYLEEQRRRNPDRATRASAKDFLMIFTVEGEESGWVQKDRDFSQGEYQKIKDALTTPVGSHFWKIPSASGDPTREDFQKRDSALLSTASVFVCVAPDYMDWHTYDMDTATSDLLLSAERAGKDIIVADPSYLGRSFVLLSADKSDPSPIKVFNIGKDGIPERASAEEEAERIGKLAYADAYMKSRGKALSKPKVEAKQTPRTKEAPAQPRQAASQQQTQTRQVTQPRQAAPSPAPARQAAPASRQSKRSGLSISPTQKSFSAQSRVPKTPAPKDPEPEEVLLGSAMRFIEVASPEALEKLKSAIAERERALTPKMVVEEPVDKAKVPVDTRRQAALAAIAEVQDQGDQWQDFGVAEVDFSGYSA